MRYGRKGLAVAVALASLAIGACHRATPQARAAPVDRRHRLVADPAAGRIILLPDSAIAVRPGSTEEQLARYLASPLPPPRTFRFAGTQFEPWASAPNTPTLRTMYAMAQILRAYPHAAVRLVGYTDNVGTPAQNLTLARARVDRLQAILVHGGIRADRIEAIGKGSTDYVADNASEQGRARNRRIELVVTAK